MPALLLLSPRTDRSSALGPASAGRIEQPQTSLALVSTSTEQTRRASPRDSPVLHRWSSLEQRCTSAGRLLRFLRAALLDPKFVHQLVQGGSTHSQLHRGGGDLAGVLLEDLTNHL